MKLYDGGIVFFIVVGIVATVIGGSNWDAKRKDQEYKFYSTCLDNAVGTEDKKLCRQLFTD